MLFLLNIRGGLHVYLFKFLQIETLILYLFTYHNQENKKVFSHYEICNVLLFIALGNMNNTYNLPFPLIKEAISATAWDCLFCSFIICQLIVVSSDLLVQHKRLSYF